MQANPELEITLTDFLWRFLEGCCKGSWASQVALVVKNTTANSGDMRDMGSVPELGRAPGGGHGNPLQYSCWGIQGQRSLVGYSP